VRGVVPNGGVRHRAVNAMHGADGGRRGALTKGKKGADRNLGSGAVGEGVPIVIRKNIETVKGNHIQRKRGQKGAGGVGGTVTNETGTGGGGATVCIEKTQSGRGDIE